MKTRYAMVGLTMIVAGYAVGADAVEPSAVLHQPTGQVFVSQATAMTPARSDMPLYAGDRVIASTTGSATVVYEGGCSVTLANNSLLAIGEPSQCEAGQTVTYATGGFEDTPIGQTRSAKSKKAVALVRRVQGTGKVNRSRAVAGMRLYRGSKVTAGAKSQIVVRYANNCEVVVQARRSLVVSKAPDCRSRRRTREDSSTTITESMEVPEAPTSTTSTAGAAGEAGVAGAAGEAGEASAAGLTGSASYLVPAGVAIAVIAGAVALSNDDDDDGDASPQ